MKKLKMLTVCIVSAALFCGQAHGKTGKTHIQIRAVDENRRPVEGVDVEVGMNDGCGELLKFFTDKDGLISSYEDMDMHAKCRFLLERGRYYDTDFGFCPSQSGSVVTGVVKRVATSHIHSIVGICLEKTVDGEVGRVGVDLLYGDLLPPFGEGRCADMYFVSREFRVDSPMDGFGNRKKYAEWWVERGDSKSEFTLVEKDRGCRISVPVRAPEKMSNVCNKKFRADYRPHGPESSPLGENEFIVFRLVRPHGVFYGYLNTFEYIPTDRGVLYCVSYGINPFHGNRLIGYGLDYDDEDSWRKYVAAAYEEEKAAKESTSAKVAEQEGKETAQNVDMMRRRAYSGRWGCGAWGFKSVAFNFDKGGFGFLDIKEQERPFGIIDDFYGWFYWTADDKGLITGCVVDEFYSTRKFRLRYDSARNIMVPDLQSELFAGQIAPLVSNPRGEMEFMPGDGIEHAKKSWRFKSLWIEHPIAEHDARMTSLPKSTVSSFSGLWKMAKEKCAAGEGVALRKNGAPEIRIAAKDDGMQVFVQLDVERRGDAAAPRLAALDGRYGPDISEKKRREDFYDSCRLESISELSFSYNPVEKLEEEGVWTKEVRRYFKAVFKKGETAKCQKLLKEVVEKWYTFPVRVIELDAEKK